MGRSIPGTLNCLVVGVLLLYFYAIAGCVLLGPHDPQRYGTVGDSALTLFLLLTLDGVGDAVREGLRTSPWSLPYYASYVLLASFVLVNRLVGVVLDSLEETRADERRERAGERDDTGLRQFAAVTVNDTEETPLELLRAARNALQELENRLTPRTGQGPHRDGMPRVPGQGPEPRQRPAPGDSA